VVWVFNYTVVFDLRRGSRPRTPEEPIVRLRRGVCRTHGGVVWSRRSVLWSLGRRGEWVVSAEEVVVVLRELRPAFCAFGGGRISMTCSTARLGRLGGFWNQRGTIGERAGVLQLDSMVKNSTQEGRAETSNKVCRRASERRPRYIRGLYQAGRGIWISWRVNCKLNYEPEGRSRAAEQILDFHIFRLEKKSDEVEPCFQLYPQSLILGGYRPFKETR